MEDKYSDLEKTLLDLETALNQMRRNYCGKECKDFPFCLNFSICAIGITEFGLATNRFLIAVNDFTEKYGQKSVPGNYIDWFKRTTAYGWNIMNKMDNESGEEKSNNLRNTMQIINLRIGLIENYRGDVTL